MSIVKYVAGTNKEYIHLVDHEHDGLGELGRYERKREGTCEGSEGKWVAEDIW
jgi:hypothetical protein